MKPTRIFICSVQKELGLERAARYVIKTTDNRPTFRWNRPMPLPICDLKLT